MKRRVSFVANSSSSSFLLCGVDRSEFKELYPNDPYNVDKDIIELDAGEMIGVKVYYNDWGSIDAQELVEKISYAKLRMESLGFKDTQFYYGVDNS